MKSLKPDRLAGEKAGEPANRVPARGRLFRKYVSLFVAVVTVALLANGLIERARQEARRSRPSTPRALP